MAQFNNATSSDALIALLDKNELRLDLTDYATLDTIGKNLVGAILLNADSFTNKAAVQAAVKGAISNAKVDAEARTYAAAFNAYTKSVVLSSGVDYFVLNNKGGLSSTDQTRLAGCHVDTVFNVNRPLEDGESIELDVDGKLIELTNQTVTANNGNKIRLSQLPGMNLNDFPMAASYVGESKIAVIENDVKQPLSLNINSALVKGNGTLIYTTNTGAACQIFPNSFDHYMNAISLSNDGNQIQFDYSKVAELSLEDKEELKDFYSDVTIYLSRPLEPGESVKVEAFNKEILMDSQTITDEDKTKIRLSKLMAVTLGDGQLATKQTGTVAVKLTDAGLKSDLYVSGFISLAKTNDEVIELNKMSGMYVKRASMDAFINSINTSVQNNIFTFSYAGKLDSDDQAGIEGYYVDEWVYTDRPLQQGESLILLVNHNEYPMNPDNYQGNGFSLSEFMQKNLTEADLAAIKSGEVIITVKERNLDSDMQLMIQPMLVKPDVWTRILTEKTVCLGLKPDYVKAYADAVTVLADDIRAAFTVTYSGFLRENIKTGLADYYSDAIISLNRPLANNETLIVHAFNQTIAVNSSTVTDNEGKEIRLSDLLDIELSEAQRADLQTGNFEVAIVGRQLNEDLNICAEPILVKSDGSIYHLNKSSNLTVGKLIPVQYQTYVDNYWQDYVSNEAMSGTINQRLPIRAVKIALTDSLGAEIPADGKICYRVYMGHDNADDLGWLNGWIDGGQIAGITDDRDCYLEAIEIKLENMPGYSVQYQVKVIDEDDWQPWVRDAAMAGTNGKNQHIEALRIRIVKTP